MATSSQTVYVNYDNSAFHFTTVDSTNSGNWTTWTPTIAYGDTVTYTFKNDNSPEAFTFDKKTTSMDWEGNDAHGCSHTNPTGSASAISFSVTNDSTDNENFYLSLVVGIVLTASGAKVESPDPQITMGPRPN